MLNLKEVLAYLDDEGNTDIFRHHNSGVDRDLSTWQLETLMDKAIAFNWYHTSFWVTGSDTISMLLRLFGAKFRVEEKVIGGPTLFSLFDRPLLMMNVVQDTLSRVYLVNYSDGVIGSVLKDLQ